MKILVFSDSHGDTATMADVVAAQHPDHILHLGDCVRDVQPLRRFSVPVTQVPGNCDYGSDLPPILTPELAGVKIYMTHGHLHGVKTMYQRAIHAALAANANILLFGHTHRPECYFDQGLWILNPGACNAQGSYGVIELARDGIYPRIQSVCKKECL